MKTLKFIIPCTISSIAALISSLKDELDILHGDSNIVSDISKTDIDDDNVVELNTGDDFAPPVLANGATDVDLDADGLPWDPRIHGSKKTKLTRGNTWKLKRGIDPAFVETVMGELRKAMAAVGVQMVDDKENDDGIVVSTTAPPPAPAASTTAPPPAPAASTTAPPPTPAPEPIYIVEGSGEFTREALIAANWTEEQIATLPVKPVETTNVVDITFPELMAKITAAGLDETVVQAALPEGIQALPLLAARPDLIPTVHAELFPA